MDGGVAATDMGAAEQALGQEMPLERERRPVLRTWELNEGWLCAQRWFKSAKPSGLDRSGGGQCVLAVLAAEPDAWKRPAPAGE